MTYPDTITTVRLTGRYVGPGGSAGSGRLTFTPSVPAATPGALLVAPERAVLDRYGRLAVYLLATDDPQWADPGFTYEVAERIDGRPARRFTISVPAAAAATGLDLADLAPGGGLLSVTRADVIEYLGGEAAMSWADEELDAVLAAELAAQGSTCRIPDPRPADLDEALCRRVAANLARRRLPLGVDVGDAERGPVRPAARDAEVRRLEAPYRRLVVG